MGGLYILGGLDARRYWHLLEPSRICSPCIGPMVPLVVDTWIGPRIIG